MLQVAEILKEVEDNELLELYQERLALVAHKLKFMDAVPTAFMKLDGQMHPYFSPYLEAAGGVLVEDASSGVYLLFGEENADLNKLMSVVPGGLEADWKAVQNGRIALLNLDFYDLNKAGDAVNFIEDLAEILHPGSFIFGNEGNVWIRYGN